MIDLGSLGAEGSYANGVNERGQVIGGSFIADSWDFHALLWEQGTVIDLGTLGGNNSYAEDINERGQVAGGSTTVSGYSHAFLWQK
jgi:probable HAF family extracellular repeat protein